MAETLESNIEEIKKDLSSTVEDKALYLAQCASKRIQYCNKSFDENLDYYVSQLEKSEMHSDLSRMTRSLKSLSKLVSLSCKGLLLIVRRYKNSS